MDTARLQQIQALFHQAVDLSAADRRPFLKTACADDDALFVDVLAMLEEDARGSSLLDGGLTQVAQQLLGGTVPPFDQFDRYRIVRLLGEGGMGVVYLAERTDLGSLVAIKFLRDAWLSPTRRDRFAIEQRTLAQLNHPSIARIYDADSLPDGTPWFVMEYIEGVPITEYCRQHAGSLNDRLRLFRSVCEAVRYAHQHAIIHRDIKPSNILVKSDGSVSLLDFGIAKQLENFDQPAAEQAQTRTALRLMTPAYAAPEQLRGERVGVFTDVYALGVVLYELLAGNLPADQPAAPSKIADLNVLCLTAIHKDPQRRYRSGEALINDIDHYLKGEPLDARPDTLGYRAGKFIGRHKRTVAAAAAVFVAVVALSVVFTVRLATARNAALAAAARTERVQRFMLNLFQGGDKSVGPAESLRVVTLLDRGIQEARTLNREPDVQAALYLTLGGIYQKLGNLNQADSLLQSALRQRQSLFGLDHPEVAESLIALGLLRVEQAHLEDAERLIRDGLAMFTRSRPRDNAAIAGATAALGKVLEARGTYGKAIPLLEEAVRLQSAGGRATPELASSIKELADTQFYAGHYGICDDLNRRSLAMHQQLFGERHPLVADDLINLGAVQFELGHYSEAERFYRKALDIMQGWYGKDHPEVASTLSMLGRTLIFEHRFDEAVKLLEQSLAIQEHVYGTMHPRVANVLNELGNVALQREHLDEAEERFRRVSEIYSAAYGDHHYRVALALANLASVYMARKEYARAERMYRDVIRRYAETLPADHLNIGIAQIKLGRALVRQKRYADAEEHTLAGYRVLMKQTSPSVTWVQSARQDLVTIYDALKQPQKAQSFRGGG